MKFEVETVGGALGVGLALVYAPVAVKIASHWKIFGKPINNVEPRRALDKLAEDSKASLVRRAQAAHQNSLEALVGLTAAIAAASFSVGPKDERLLSLANHFIYLRAAYVAVYVSPLNSLGGGLLRSIIWALGMYQLWQMFAL
jgi:uncharacterized MAPEG superfamily protein